MLMTTASEDVRWLYLMTMKDDAILFTVDGIPLKNPGHADPGTPYAEPPPELAPVFRTGDEVVVGPYSDEYGTFVSAFAPIRERFSGRVFGVLGVDVDAADWAAAVTEQRLEPLLITLLLALMLIGFYVVQERRRIDALTLAESEREYRSVLESMGDVFYRSDRDGRLTMASPSFARVLGYGSVDEALGMDLAHEFYEHPSQRAELLERLERDGAVTDLEVTVRRHDGTIIEGAVTGNFYRDAVGEVQGVEGVLRDMTERKRAQRALVEAEERGRLLLTSVGEGIFGVDHLGHVIFMNPAAEDLLGWTAEELHGVRMHDAIHYAREDGSPFPIEECAQHDAYARGLTSRVDDEVLWRKDGTCFPVEYIARPLMNDGAVTGAIVSFRDISARRAAEEALRENRERLDFVLRAAEVGVWEWEIGPDFVQWDETVAALYGLPADLQRRSVVGVRRVHPPRGSRGGGGSGRAGDRGRRALRRRVPRGPPRWRDGVSGRARPGAPRRHGRSGRAERSHLGHHHAPRGGGRAALHHVRRGACRRLRLLDGRRRRAPVRQPHGARLARLLG